MVNAVDIRSAGYGIVPKLVMRDRRLSISAKGLYAYLSSYAGSDNECYPTRKKICYDLNICSSVVSRCMKELTDTGYIRKDQVRCGGRFMNNIYRLNQAVTQPEDTINISSDAEYTANSFTVSGNTVNGDIGNGIQDTTINNKIINNKTITKNKNNSSKNTSQTERFRFLEPDADFFASIM